MVSLRFAPCQCIQKQPSRARPTAVSRLNGGAVMATDEEVQSYLLNQWLALQEHLTGPACHAMFAQADAKQMVSELLRTQDLGGERATFSKLSLDELQLTNAHLRKNNSVLLATAPPMRLTQEVGEWFHADQRHEMMARWGHQGLASLCS
jgi:hypothetical protein